MTEIQTVVHPHLGKVCSSSGLIISIPDWLRGVVQPTHGTSVMCELCGNLGIWPNKDYEQAMVKEVLGQ